MDQQQQSQWRPTRKQLLWTGVAVALLTIAILIGYRYDITLWDWLKLLVIPAVIAGGGLWFNRQQRERELETAREQRDREEKNTDHRAQDEALQAYLNEMGHLLLEKSLRNSKDGSEARTLARARTLTVLLRLDNVRKHSVVQFLSESRLIDKNRPIVVLRGANLREAELSFRISGPEGTYAANLERINLSGADLSRADLFFVNLVEVDLSNAILVNADLSVSNLTKANLTGAYLVGADLSGADLSNASLYGADLTDANLTGTSGGTEAQLKEATLEGATMPNGQKYEEWLKEREGREKDRENN